ncbi:MAG: aspartate-semialdehyde dehydrogenase [Clostridia bacterium]|nr:aspartate-semialdehyde dehydrogenase [Clostridia bacterium]
MKLYDISVIGATGLVGRTFLNILLNSSLPIGKVHLYASEKSEGKILMIGKRSLTVNCLSNYTDKKEQFIVLACKSSISKLFVSNYSGNAVIIDNSSAFRMKKHVPIIIPPINAPLAKNKKILANPNCVVATISLHLFLINKKYKITDLNISTYQAVSGSGQRGIEHLSLAKENKFCDFYQYDISKTCIAKIGEIIELGQSEEELKVADELKKILNNYDTHICVSCVRVPVENCHGANVTVCVEKDFLISDFESLFTKENAIIFLSNKQNELPNSITAAKSEYVFLGRLRLHSSKKNCFQFYIVGDNLYRGAAYNAYQIIEYLINDGNI